MDRKRTTEESLPIPTVEKLMVAKGTNIVTRIDAWQGHFILLNSEIPQALEITIPLRKGSIDKRCGQPIDISIAGKEHPNKTTKKQHTNTHFSIRQEHLHAM